MKDELLLAAEQQQERESLTRAVMVRRFLKAVARSLVLSLTGWVSILLAVLALYLQIHLQREAWVIVVVLSLLVAPYSAWCFEFRRAEEAEAKLATQRPWIVIDEYSASVVEDEETGQDDLWESIRVVNRGLAPAVNVTIPGIRLFGRAVQPQRSLPTLGPGESASVDIRNLDRVLKGALLRIPLPTEGPRTLHVPMVVVYSDGDHRRWETLHCITCDVYGIRFTVANTGDPRQWSDLSAIKEARAPA
jgi:hypothetical protein